MYELLAAALLLGPPGTPEPPPHADDWIHLRDALHAVAIDWEILDPRETRYVLARPDVFEDDLDLLRPLVMASASPIAGPRTISSASTAATANTSTIASNSKPTGPARSARRSGKPTGSTPCGMRSAMPVASSTT